MNEVIKTLADKLHGYYRAEYTADFPEAILTRLMRENIPVWHIRRIDSKTISFRCSRRSSERVREAIDELVASGGGRGGSVKRFGLPRIVMKYSRRIGLFAGSAFSLVLLAVMSRFVWIIKIEGNALMTTAEVMETLSSVGLEEGAYSGDFDLYNMQLDYLIKNPDISYISINLQGTAAYVQIRERQEKMQSEDTSGIYNLVADHPGKIVRYAIAAGDSAVRVGENVFKGQLLVSGLTENSLGIFSAVHASGKVYAETEHEFETTVPLESAQKHYTGRETVKKSVIFMGKEIKLFVNSGITYQLYDTITLYEDALAFERAEMPFRIKKQVFLEYTESSESISPERATDMCYDEYKDFLTYGLADSKITDEQVDVSEENGAVTLRAKVKCIENIAVGRKVEVVDFPEDDSDENKHSEEEKDTVWQN